MSQLVKTKRQANFKGFKRFGAFKGLVSVRNAFVLFWKILLGVSVLTTNSPKGQTDLIIY
jgi:hypothetical protein